MKKISYFFCVTLILFLQTACGSNDLQSTEFLFQDNNMHAKLNYKARRTSVYFINIGFVFSNQYEKAEARRIAGDASHSCQQLDDCGIIISFFVSIKRQDGTNLLSQKFVTVGHYRFNERRFDRNITHIHLDPGVYVVEVTSDSIDINLINFKPELSINLDPRSN